MNRRTWIFIVSLLSIFVLGAVSSFYLLKKRVASDVGSIDDLRAFHGWAHSLGLGPEQEIKIEPLEKKLRADLADIQKRLSEERMTLCGLMHQETVDAKKVDEQLSRIGILETEQQKQVVHHLLAMRGFLTPEQRDKLFSNLQQSICKSCRSRVHQNKGECEICDMKK